MDSGEVAQLSRRIRIDRALVAVLVVALLARVAVVAGDWEYAALFDSGDYDRHARSIAHGDGFPRSAFTASDSPTAFRPPLYPYTLGAVYWVSGDSFNAGRLTGALLGVVSVLLVFLVARTLWNRRAGLLAAGLAAVAPGMFFMHGALINEPLFVPLVLAALWFALLTREREGDLRLAAAAGVCCGLAALTRTNGALLVIPVAGLLWTLRPRFSRAALMAPIVAVVATTLTILPWTIRNAIEFEQFVPTADQSGLALAGTYNDDSMDVDGYTGVWIEPNRARRYAPLFKRTDLNEAELDRELRRQALEFAFDNPRYVAETTVLGTLRMLEFAGEAPAAGTANRLALNLSLRAARVERFAFYLLALLALVGAVMIARMPRDRRPPVWLWVIPILLVIPLLPVLGTTRYRLPTYPFLILAATPALVAAADRLASIRSARRKDLAV